MGHVWSDVAFPWGPEVKTFIEPKDDNDVLRTSLLMIMMTNPGERVMMPEFGIGLLRRLFEPLDDILEAEIKAAVREGLQQDDRIELLDFQIDQDPNQNRVSLRLLVKNAKDPLADAVLIEEEFWEEV